MKSLALSAVLFAAALPVLAQVPEPATAPDEDAPKPSFRQRVFFGGSVGAGFGTVDYVAVAPMVGFHVVPRLDLGVQPFYRWTSDGRYSPSVSTTDYGAGVFARVHIFKGLFGEADYEYSNYEYVNGGLSTRDTHNAFLAGAGYSFPVGQNVGLYASALYDFTYDANQPYSPYDSPVRYQVGVAVGF
jgi:hypothetical protein